MSVFIYSEQDTDTSISVKWDELECMSITTENPAQELIFIDKNRRKHRGRKGQKVGDYE